MDISEMSREELIELKDSIDRRLVEIEKEQRVAALAEMREIANRHGISLNEMVEMATGQRDPFWRSSEIPRSRKPGEYLDRSRS